jgi:hypothetical protein
MYGESNAISVDQRKGANMKLATGLALLAVAMLLFYIGRPDKDGNSPKFLQFSAALVLYPPVVLIFFAFGAIVTIYAFL